MPTKKTRQKELIVGGDLNLSEDDYVKRLGESIKACLTMLKRGRWFSVVFQHWNTSYFDAILSCAAGGWSRSQSRRPAGRRYDLVHA